MNKIKSLRMGINDDLNLLNNCPECHSNLVIYDSRRG